MSSTGIKGDGGLEAMIASCKALEGASWASSVGPAVDSFMRGRLAAGQTPEGESWPVTKEGHKALAGAAEAYEQHVSGNAIIMKIGGGAKKRYAMHNFGAQEKPVRRQLPAGKMPARLGAAIRAGLVSQFEAATRAGKRGYAYYRTRGINPRTVR